MNLHEKSHSLYGRIFLQIKTSSNRKERPLMYRLSQAWSHIQATLFPFLVEHLDPLTETQRKLIAIIELIQIDDYIPNRCCPLGRPEADRGALAKSFVAKMVYNCTTTRELIEQLSSNPNLRRLCGWERAKDIPSESTFSRAFDEFAVSGLPARVHEALIEKHEKQRLVGHISRDTTDISAREKAKPAEKKKKPKRKHKRGRPRRGEQRPPKEPTRLERQMSMTVPEMLADLPAECDWGKKKKNGRLFHWKGCKLHVDWADGEIPVSVLLTSASTHDSQGAIPLSMISAQRVTSFYDLMDAAYDAATIREHSLSLGHIPIIDRNPRKEKKVEMDPAKKRRYDERSTAERGNSLFKDSFGGRHQVRVRGHAKVFAHLMFGLVALTADRLLNLLL
jgi:transposase